MDKIVDKDKRKAEWTAVLIFTLDEIFMIMRTVRMTGDISAH